MSHSDRQALSSVESRLRSVLDTAFNAYISMDTRGLITDWNRQAEATFGFSREEAIGRVLSETIIPSRYREAHQRGLAHFLTTGEGPVLNKRLQITAVHRDGREFPVELTIWPLREGDNWTFHAFVHDITDLREAQHRAMESQRQAAVADIISALTHETSNALQQIQLASDLLAIEFQDSPEALEQLALIQKAEDRLALLFRDIHGYAIPLKLKPRIWNLAVIWQEAWAQLGALRQDRQAGLGEELADANVNCSVDRSGMEQVFRILLQNALTRCPDPVRIEIFCREDELQERPALQIAVRDNGPPLPVDQRRQVFGLVDVARIHDPASELTIAARIVDAHGGRITASNGANLGAEFLITLPRGE